MITRCLIRLAPKQLLRGIVKTGIVLVDVRDVTPVPTPGTRPPAARRL